jgi:hypothetical protein
VMRTSLCVLAGLLLGCTGRAPEAVSPSEQRPASPSAEEGPPTPPDEGGDAPALPALAACEGGLDVPAFDPQLSTWWDASTKQQREAAFSSASEAHWGDRSKGPITLHIQRDQVVLRAVDGCWSEAFPLAVPRNVVIDGPSGVLWAWSPRSLQLVDLLNPAAVLDVAAGLSARDVVIVGVDERSSLRWSVANAHVFGSMPRPEPELHVYWETSPHLLLEGGARGGSRAHPLLDGARKWLEEHHERHAPVVRTTWLDLSQPLASQSACKATEICLGAAPFGASGLEVVRIGEIDITVRDDTAGGPTCAVFDPSTGTWESAFPGRETTDDPRSFEDDDVACDGGWLFDVSGRAYLRGGQLCTAAGCVRTRGAVGFVRGHVVVSAR